MPIPYPAETRICDGSGLVTARTPDGPDYSACPGCPACPR